MRWRIFLRHQGIRLPYNTVLCLSWGGQFFNSVLPGSTGGDIIKLIGICSLVPERKAAAASTVFVDRLSALVALLVLAAAAICIYPKPLTLLPLPKLTVSSIIFLVIGAVSVGVAVLWLLHRLTRASHFHGKIARTLAAAKSNLTLDPSVIAALFLAFFIHVLNFTIIFFFARALAIPVNYGQVLFMMPVILFVVMVPITINGHGLREMLLIAYFTSMGVVIANQPAVHVRETAVALSLVAVANDLAWAIPGGLWYLNRFRHVPRT
jgi:uncharacterized membrane protein YbhN (UPF0104 family)